MAVADEVLAALGRQQPPALFYSELAARVPDADLDAAVSKLEQLGAVLVLPHDAPDQHLEGIDLRVVASALDGELTALRAAEAAWGAWLRQFLATHRCQ
ncbi:MAG: hypothetical protein JO247_15525 [Chloroflexi bacterium]|nr:hypothetical protein [Chloroflexota bacterium]